MTQRRVPHLDTFAFQQPVLDKDLTAPPGSPSKGDRYIVGAGALTWQVLTSANKDSVCGEAGYTLAGALDGTGEWRHSASETHWFILDLGSSKNIVKIRGRSNSDYADPTKVNIYISDSKVDWGAAVVTNISTWQNVSSWVEIDCTDKTGRYIKVEITATESGEPAAIGFGCVGIPFTIFDVATQTIATGAWAGQDGKITYYDGANWQFVTPEEGWLVYISDENKYYTYTGSAWVITAII